MTHEYSKQHQKYYALNPISHRRKSIKSELDTAYYYQTTQSTHESHISKHDMRKNSFSRLESISINKSVKRRHADISTHVTIETRIWKTLKHYIHPQ